MIFPPESIHEFRRDLLAKMTSGALSEAEACRQRSEAGWRPEPVEAR